jgi:hypothetical protein
MLLHYIECRPYARDINLDILNLGEVLRMNDCKTALIRFKIEFEDRLKDYIILAVKQIYLQS